jgi:putative ABC transport system ATP-binding protein
VVVTGNALEAHELYRFYHAGDDETFALRGVSLEVREGETVAVVGPSGSGKSTLLACLAGLDDPDGGYVVVAGHRITRRPEAFRSSIRARSIGILLQVANLLEHLSLLDNVRTAQSLVGSRDRPDPHRLLEDVGLGHRARARPSTLSGGEAARAGLAVALANDPAIVLADEPTGEVDHDTESQLLQMLRSRAERGSSVVVVTHSDRVAAAADRVLQLSDGRLADG